MTGIILSLLMLAAFALLLGAWIGWRRGMPRHKVALMVGAALVMALNVGIWTMPVPSGDTLAGEGSG